MEGKNSGVYLRNIGYDFIRFFATLMILCHHFCTTCEEKHIPYARFVRDLIQRGVIGWGKVGVGLFFILSGAVLWKSNQNEFSLKKYYSKRLLRLMVPQWVGFIIAFFVIFIFNGEIAYDIKNQYGICTFASFMGFSYVSAFWRQFGLTWVWTVGEWFTAVIIFIYLCFPLLRCFFLKHRWITTAVIAAIFLINLNIQFLSYSNNFFSFTNGLLYFWLGMLFEEYKQYFNWKISLAAVVGVAVLFAVNPSAFFGVAYLPCFVMSVMLFIALYNMKISNRFTQYICCYNYEIYLVHHRVFLVTMPFWLNSESSWKQVLAAFLLLSGLTFLLAEQLQCASNGLLCFCRTIKEKQRAVP